MKNAEGCLAFRIFYLLVVMKQEYSYLFFQYYIRQQTITIDYKRLINELMATESSPLQHCK